MLIYKYFIIVIIIIILHDVYIVDQGGKDLGLGRNGCGYCFQTFYLFFPHLEEGGR